MTQDIPITSPLIWHCADRKLSLEKPLIMGIVNTTPDSFYEGSRVQGTAESIDRCKALINEGADILDIGGESTRPGALAVDVESEIARVVPVIEAVSPLGIPVSADTSKGDVAKAALEAGAIIINDVWSLKADPKMADVVGGSQCGLILMHARGRASTMSSKATYSSLLTDIYEETSLLLESATAAGVHKGRIVLDPGIGFAKLASQNLLLLQKSGMLLELGCAVLVGASRKSFLEQCFGHTIDQRLEGSLAAIASAVLGGARILRVHDVAETRRFLDVFWAIQRASS